MQHREETHPLTPSTYNYLLRQRLFHGGQQLTSLNATANQRNHSKIDGRLRGGGDETHKWAFVGIGIFVITGGLVWLLRLSQNSPGANTASTNTSTSGPNTNALACTNVNTELSSPRRTVSIQIEGRGSVTMRGNSVGFQTHGPNTVMKGMVVGPDSAIGFVLKGDTVLVYNVKTHQLLAKVQTDDSSALIFSGTPEKVHSIAHEQQLLGESSSTQPLQLGYRQKAVYARAYILEHFDLRCPALLKYASSVAIIIEKKHVIKKGRFYRLKSKRTLNDHVRGLTEDRLPLEQSQPFRNQYAVGHGTAFLGARKRIITAGHCIDGYNISNYYVIFNFIMLKANSPKTQFKHDEVYTMKKVISYKYIENEAHPEINEDWAVVELDRAVKDRPIAVLGSGKPDKDTALYVIGHPLGLPLKIDIGARVKRKVHSGNNPHYFFADLNTFRGNSGSPVFDVKTGHVEGILVRGKPDFVIAENKQEILFAIHSQGYEECNTISDIKPFCT